MTDDGEEVVTERDDSGSTEVGETTDRSDESQRITVDSAAESFLELESQVRGTGPETVRGRAIDVEQVPTDEVPADYPAEIDSPEALALTVGTGTVGDVTVYFAWEDGAVGEGLRRLLTVHDVAPDRFADLHGKSILLTAEDGHYVPYVPPEAVHGSELGAYGVGAGLGVNLLTILLVVVGLGGALSSVGVVLALLAVNLVGLPLSTYVDGWYLRTQTDWGQWPAFWAALAVIPGLNVLSAAAYLWSRRKATPLAE